MKNLKDLSNNALSESIHAVNEAIYTLERTYSHVADFLAPEIRTLKEKRDELIKESERREDNF